MGKVLKSTGRKLQCLSASKKSTSSLTSFLRLQRGHSVIMFTRRGVGREHQYIKICKSGKEEAHVSAKVHL